MNIPRKSGRRALLAAAGVAALAPVAHAQMRGARTQASEGAPLADSPEESRVLEVLEDVYRNHHYLSVPPSDGRLLRVLTESIGAKHVVEVGTSTGYSGLWMLLALMKTGGRLTTYEADAGRHAMARANFDRAGVSTIARLVLGDAHAEVAKMRENIDLLFIDADKEGYLDYLRKLRPLVRAGGLIVSHNMRSPRPDPAYVKAITTDAALETIFLNMDDAGVGVTLKKR